MLAFIVRELARWSVTWDGEVEDAEIQSVNIRELSEIMDMPDFTE